MNQHIYFKNISLTSGRPYSLKIRGLSLYPVRYMLWEKEMEFREILDPFLISFNSNGTDFKTNYQFINSEKEIKPTTVIPSTLPSIEGKKYVLSPIREGWIYVFNNNKKIWYEYKVLPDGRLHKCKWEEPVDDIRTPNDVIVDYIELDKRGIFYLAFSEVQWSQKYLSRLENSEEMRKERMQYLDTTKINNGKNNKDVFSPTDVNIVFNTSPFTIATGIEPLNKMDGDLFLFGFNDPLAIADQLSFEIVNYFDEIEAIIQSIQLGVDPVIIKNALKNGKDTFSLQKKEISNQTLALHKMALLLYHICFGSEESSKRLGIHLDRDRIEKILAVKERKEIRNKIVKNRKNLIEFLKSKNYINALQDYHNNNSEKQIIGKTRVTSHLISLSLPVNAKDKLLDLPERNNQKDEDIESLNFLRDVFEEKNEIGKIIAENINVTLANITTINAVVQTWDNIINAFSNL
ncbi:MAG: hypothetical protein N2053_11950, partial [Chitinispirillaceae bacterium]|nr:hypothetical protein [Chitinispirillaceae bacterium]